MLPSVPSRFSRPAPFSRIGKGAAYFGIAALLALTAATAQIASAQVASGTTGIDATGSARSEMAACKSGKTQQSREACMHEVRNANAEKRAGKLGGSGADFTANAMKRCEVFKESDDQAACRARVESEAKLDGSVGSGGVLRQSEITIPAVRK